VLSLPLGVILAAMPWRPGAYAAALDAWTPPMFAVLAVSRVGCFLQGCCYGVRSPMLGISFPPGGLAHERQLATGLVAPGSLPLPVVPTQLIEAAALFGLSVAAFAQLRRGRTGIFLPFVAAYSAFRFLAEFLRDDPERNALAGLSTSQWTALVLLGGYALWRQSQRQPLPA
jgi:phosphatidylglycerol:prolipoprotein diacylglycerol transferase